MLAALGRDGFAAHPGIVNFSEGGGQILGDVPAGIMRFHFGEVGDVTDVVASTVLLDVFVVHFLPEMAEIRSKASRMETELARPPPRL